MRVVDRLAQKCLRRRATRDEDLTSMRRSLSLRSLRPRAVETPRNGTERRYHFQFVNRILNLSPQKDYLIGPKLQSWKSLTSTFSSFKRTNLHFAMSMSLARQNVSDSNIHQVIHANAQTDFWHDSIGKALVQTLLYHLKQPLFTSKFTQLVPTMSRACHYYRSTIDAEHQSNL